MAETSKKEYNTPQLIRKYCLFKWGKGSFNNKDAQNLLNEFRKILYSPQDIDENKVLSVDDYANQLFLTLDNAVTKNTDFFSSVLEETEENNKKIIGYLYALIKSSKREVKDSIDNREINILHNSIKEICKKLLENDKIIKLPVFKKAYYSKKDNLEKEKYEEQKIDLNPEKIHKKDSIDRTKLEKYLEYIFNSYPNYKFSTYDLVKLVALNTDVGTVSIFNEASVTAYEEDEEFSIDNTLTEQNNYELSNITLDSTIIDIWWDRVIKKFGSKDNAEDYAITFYLSYSKGYTLKKIEVFFNHRIKKSSIDNYKKIFIKVLEIDKDLKSYKTETIKNFIHSFCLLLEQKYDVLRRIGVSNE